LSIDYNNISKFLNRILGIEVELQNKLFRYFTDTLTTVIFEQKRRGAWDMGILGRFAMLIYILNLTSCGSWDMGILGGFAVLMYLLNSCRYHVAVFVTTR